MVQDDKANKISTIKLIRIAKTNARKSVAFWLWGSIGILISLIPLIKIPALILCCLSIPLLKPKIDLSKPEIIHIYSQHPALYTLHYMKHAKILRIFNVLCGWIGGFIILSLV